MQCKGLPFKVFGLDPSSHSGEVSRRMASPEKNKTHVYRTSLSFMLQTLQAISMKPVLSGSTTLHVKQEWRG
jgi:hypothetical protein